jgi:hypothetical protein
MGLVRVPGCRPRRAVLQTHTQGLHTLAVGADQRERAAESHAWVYRPATYPGLGLSLGTLDLAACQVPCTLDLAAAKSMFPWIWSPAKFMCHHPDLHVMGPSSRPKCNGFIFWTQMQWLLRSYPPLLGLRRTQG